MWSYSPQNDPQRTRQMSSGADAIPEGMPVQNYGPFGAKNSPYGSPDIRFHAQGGFHSQPPSALGYKDMYAVESQGQSNFHPSSLNNPMYNSASPLFAAPEASIAPLPGSNSVNHP
jgi:hypothetical protein